MTNKAIALKNLAPDSEWLITNDEITWLDHIQTCPTDKEISAEVERLKAEQPKNEVREQRNFLLSESDWTQVSDAPVDQQAWANYRQALRDVPQQTGFPADVNWPTKPE